jgi:hypothetical protein
MPAGGVGLWALFGETTVFHRGLLGRFEMKYDEAVVIARSPSEVTTLEPDKILAERWWGGSMRGTLGNSLSQHDGTTSSSRGSGSCCSRISVTALTPFCLYLQAMRNFGVQAGHE